MLIHKQLSIIDRLRVSAIAAMFIVATAHAASPGGVTDKDFVQEAFATAQVEIEMSRVVADKGIDTRTKKLAKTIIRENSAANSQLQTLASTRRLDLPRELEKEQLQRIEQLKQADQKTLDAIYREQLVQTHSASIQLFDQVAKNPRADAELRVFASKRLPLYRKQQQTLEKIDAASAKVAQR